MKGLSVAVLVDSEALTAAAVSAEDLRAGLVAATGAIVAEDPAEGERSDNFQVLQAKFKVAEPVEAGLPTAMIGDIVPTAAGGLLAVVLLFLVWRNMKALRGRAEDMQLLAARMNPAQLGPGELSMAGGYGSFADADMPELMSANSPQAKVQERIRLMAEEKPEELAGLVNTWLHEDEKGRRR